MNNTDWQQLLQLGIQAVREQRGAQALDTLLKAQALQPGSRDVCYWLGNAQRMCGQAANAERTFRNLLLADPTDLEAGFSLAFLLRENSRVPELSELLLALADNQKNDSPGLLKIAGFLRDSNQFPAAISAMRMVLSNEPEVAGHYFRLARLYQGVGQHPEALKAYREAIRRDAGMGGAWLGLAQLQQFSDPENPDWKMITAPSPQLLSLEATMCIAFARGKGYNDLAEYEQAWTCFLEGNAVRHQSQGWSRAEWNRFVEQVIALPIGQPVTEPSSTGNYTTTHGKPVYIVGMLRSGTTLLEQLLDQHPRITARGELNFLSHAWNSLHNSQSARPAASDLAKLLYDHLQLDGPRENFYIDKNPLNFRFLSLLAEVLPQARILHVKRDGRDACLSCFSQLFQHGDTAFSNQLGDLVDYYHGYLRLMQHFQNTMPGQILSLAYEDLVRETPETLERTIQFLGLEESNDFLAENVDKQDTDSSIQQRPIRTASTWQARQVIHSRSIGRWEDYYSLAPEFFDQLKKLDQEYGND